MHATVEKTHSDVRLVLWPHAWGQQLIHILRLNLREWIRTLSIFKSTTSIRTKLWCNLNLDNEGQFRDIKIFFDTKANA